jgi:hypothetical protein
MIAAIRWLATICGLVFIVAYLAGAPVSAWAVLLVAFLLIFTHVRLEGPE